MGDSYRIRATYNGKMLQAKATPDFFEACCRRKSLENKLFPRGARAR